MADGFGHDGRMPTTAIAVDAVCVGSAIRHDDVHRVAAGNHSADPLHHRKRESLAGLRIGRHLRGQFDDARRPRLEMHRARDLRRRRAVTSAGSVASRSDCTSKLSAWAKPLMLAAFSRTEIFCAFAA